MAIQNTTFRVYVEKLGATEALDFIGNEGDLFYNPNEAELRLSDGTTPGGNTVSSLIAPTNPPAGIGTGVLIGTLDQIDIISTNMQFDNFLSCSLSSLSHLYCSTCNLTEPSRF